MDDTTRKAIVNKEIETYRKLAVAFESLKVVVKRFDGKCINKKFGEALDDFLKYEDLDNIDYIGGRCESVNNDKGINIIIKYSIKFWRIQKYSLFYL